jgi:hypothetical protein
MTDRILIAGRFLYDGTYREVAPGKFKPALRLVLGKFNRWRAREVTKGRRVAKVASVYFGHGPARWHSFIADGPDRGAVVSAFLNVLDDESKSRELEFA